MFIHMGRINFIIVDKKFFFKQVFNILGMSHKNVGSDQNCSRFKGRNEKKIDHNSDFPNLTKNIKTLGIVESK